MLVWGSNKEGQLGLGDDGEENVYQPRILSPPLAEDGSQVYGKVKAISCGYYHSALVSDQGDIYTFGEADGGKLGVEDISRTHLPRKVQMPEKVRKYYMSLNIST